MFPADSIRTHLKLVRQQGRAIIVAGVGSGLTARAASLGGADVLAVYNTAIYRIQGLPTALAFLPYDDANALTLAIAPQVIANAGNTPVLLGFGAHDPRRPISWLIEQAVALGASGITNEPFVSIYGDSLQKHLENLGLGFRRELDLIYEASRQGLFTLGWAFSPEQAVQLRNVGADCIGAMIGGVTSGGVAGSTESNVSLEEVAEKVADFIAALQESAGDVPVLLHGGPLNSVESVAYVLERCNASGYVTGSTAERVPVERSVASVVAEFKALRTRLTM